MRNPGRYIKMGLSKSKIPVPLPGQVLKHIGIKEYDDFYTKLEKSVRTISHQTIELDHRTTDLIKYLGASSV